MKWRPRGSRREKERQRAWRRTQKDGPTLAAMIEALREMTRDHTLYADGTYYHIPDALRAEYMRVLGEEYTIKTP